MHPYGAMATPCGFSGRCPSRLAEQGRAPPPPGCSSRAPASVHPPPAAPPRCRGTQSIPGPGSMRRAGGPHPSATRLDSRNSRSTRSIRGPPLPSPSRRARPERPARRRVASWRASRPPSAPDLPWAVPGPPRRPHASCHSDPRCGRMDRRAEGRRQHGGAVYGGLLPPVAHPEGTNVSGHGAMLRQRPRHGGKAVAPNSRPHLKPRAAREDAADLPGRKAPSRLGTPEQPHTLLACHARRRPHSISPACRSGPPMMPLPTLPARWPCASGRAQFADALRSAAGLLPGWRASDPATAPSGANGEQGKAARRLRRCTTLEEPDGRRSPFSEMLQTVGEVRWRRQRGADPAVRGKVPFSTVTEPRHEPQHSIGSS